MLNFNENQVTKKHFYTNYIDCCTFMPNCLSFSCVFFLLNFSSFETSWIRIRIPNADPDPGDQLNADPSGSGSETCRYAIGNLTQECRSLIDGLSNQNSFLQVEEINLILAI
jgi:hypothetical protein